MDSSLLCRDSADARRGSYVPVGSFFAGFPAFSVYDFAGVPSFFQDSAEEF